MAALPAPTCELGSIEAIKQCVRHGLGAALVPEIAVREELDSGKLIALPFSHPQLRFFTQLIYRKRKWLSPSFRQLLALLTVGTAALIPDQEEHE